MSSEVIMPQAQKSLETEDLKAKTVEDVPNDEKPVQEKVKEASNDVKYIYTKEKMLELRSAPSALVKPKCLNEDFFTREGVWDPESWHRSEASRSASPALLDGKIAVGVKKSDPDFSIELAPRRKSFHQGCHVNAGAEKSQAATFDKKNRLTGRAQAQRKSIETKYREDERFERKDHSEYKYDEKRERYHDDKRSYDRYEDKRSSGRYEDKPSSGRYEEKRSSERYEDKRSDRYNDEKRSDRHNDDKRSSDRYNDRFDHRYTDKYGRDRRDDRDDGRQKEGRERVERRNKHREEEKLPEWMTDGPTSQLDIIELTGFKDIEEEKKAYAKRNNPKLKAKEKEDKAAKEKEEKTAKPAAASNKKPAKPNSGKNSKNTTPSDKMFDINDFFQEVNYYPPHLFHEDEMKGDGVKSRFTRWFQSKNVPNQPRPSSAGTVVPEEIFNGSHQNNAPYFTPIQPATGVQPTPNMLNFTNKKNDEAEEQKKEIRGRLNVAHLEHQKATPPVEQQAGTQNAFDMFVKSMKASGQLPAKPAPVVTGLPDHLLPKPPKLTSPTFNNLKRALSRTPSPVQVVNAVSTVANILASNPSIDSELAYLQAIRKNSVGGKNDLEVSQIESSTPQPKKMPTQFMPTSVLKKMHNEKSRDSPAQEDANDSMITQPDFSRVANKSLSYQDLPTKTSGNEIVGQCLNSQFDKLMSTPNKPILQKDGNLPFNSLPATPMHLSKPDSYSVSAPGSPENRNFNPPPVHRFASSNMLASTTRESAFSPTSKMLLKPSSFERSENTSTVGVIGSRPKVSNREENSIDQRGSADPRLAPGNGVIRNANSMPSILPQTTTNNNSSNPLLTQPPLMQSTPAPAPSGGASQQQHMLHAQRMAQIQQAQLHQQQKLQQIAQQANQQRKAFTTSASGVRPLLPDPTTENARTDRYQQQQQEQINAFRQQHQGVPTTAGHRPPFPPNGAHMQNNFFNGMRPPPNHMFPGMGQNQLPLPMMQPRMGGMPGGMQNGGVAGVNLAAQALLQQQMIRQRFLAQAQLMQQRPQMMQAALMAQAALARGQAQAAMMLNSKNIQAMAEQMGIRKNKNNNLSQPQNNEAGGSGKPDDILSKWFNNDTLQQQMPKQQHENVLSVAELEERQPSTA